MRSRKGQITSQGAPAAGLIAIIVGLIIIYILFLPPKTRTELLFGNETTPGVGGAGGVGGIGTNVSTQSLLLEHPGKLDFLARNEIEHQRPTLHLFSKTESQILKKVDSISVSNSWFSEKTSTFNFSIADVSNTNNVVLSFNVLSKQGNLIIKLNGREVLNRETDPNVAIILPQELLRGENQLEFSVSGVGAAFWRTNSYTLQGVKVTADVASVDTLKARDTFIITSTEKNALDTATLRFYLDCAGESRPLMVSINQHEIFSGVPDCGVQRPIEFLPQLLLSGENSLYVETSKGADYTLDQLVIKTKLKQLTPPVYFFEINQDQLDAVNAGTKKVMLYMRFPDAVEQKSGEIWINGVKTSLDTREISYDKDISQYVLRGSNAIEIHPTTSLFILDLEVRIQ